jgi:peroxiredoxin (alkyl hydroperoxide reductase subunit C)
MTAEALPNLQVGQDVPDFEMTTFEPTTGAFGKYSLKDNKKAGKWSVLVFYPADFTFVCATEFAALAERQAQFDKLGARLATVSCDTQFTHLAWQREEKELKDVKYAMAADPTGKVARIFNVYMPNDGLALRGSFIISPDGKLMTSEINVLNIGRNMDDLLRRLKANVYLKDAPGEVCPADWKDKGDKTLKPGPEMVGKVHKALRG